jgi:hypothetical protein
MSAAELHPTELPGDSAVLPKFRERLQGRLRHCRVPDCWCNPDTEPKDSKDNERQRRA